MIDGREGAMGVFHLKSQIPDHAESLRTGHLMNQVRADEQLCAAISQSAHGVSIPDFLVEGLSHLVPPVAGTGNLL